MIIDDGNEFCSASGGSIYSSFENPTEEATGLKGYPVYAFIDHEMKVHKLEYAVSPAFANIFIQQMIDNCGDLCIENDDTCPYVTCWDESCVDAESECPEELGIDLNTPADFKISNIYPNPFNPKLNIAFDVYTYDNVLIEVYDVNGRYVDTLLSNFLNPGSYEINWNANLVVSGIYLVSIKYKNEFFSKQVVLLK